MLHLKNLTRWIFSGSRSDSNVGTTLPQSIRGIHPEAIPIDKFIISRYVKKKPFSLLVLKI